VCEDCGRVIDIYADTTAVRVPGAQRHGFTINTTEVVFRGWCPECRDQARRKEVHG